MTKQRSLWEIFQNSLRPLEPEPVKSFEEELDESLHRLDWRRRRFPNHISAHQLERMRAQDFTKFFADLQKQRG